MHAVVLCRATGLRGTISDSPRDELGGLYGLRWENDIAHLSGLEVAH